MQQANENGIAHIVIRETLGAVAHFACGGWNYWVHLKHGGGQPCAACARQMAEINLLPYHHCCRKKLIRRTR